MLVYLLKANIALTLFYVAYRFGLRRLTFYTLNRFFLLGGIVCAALFPFIDASLFFQRHKPLTGAVLMMPDLALLNARPATPLINVVLLYVFWTGVIVMTIRFLIQLFSLWKLHRKTTIASINHDEIRVTAKKVIPFSFLSNIYVNPSLHSPVELLAVIKHEQIHVKQLHSLDIILGELNRIFYWFNPGAWLMSTAIRENLEFITDRCVLEQGMDAKAYQYSLINVSGIPYATAIANNFNFSHLKQRIMMMNKKESSQYHLLRYFVLGGVVATVLLSLNVSRAGNMHNIATRLNFAADTVTPPPPPPPAPPAPEVKQVKFAKPKAKQVPPPPPPAPPPPPPPAPVPPAPKVIGFSTGTPGNNIFITSDRVQTVENPAEKGLSYRRTAVNPDGTPVNGTPMYILDGVSQGRKSPDIKAEDIASISVVKNDASGQYGEDAKNGIIFINSKEYAAKHKEEIKAELNKVAQPIYLIDGKPATNLEKISPDDIESIQVYKGESATARFGSAGANGVVDVKMKIKK